MIDKNSEVHSYFPLPESKSGRRLIDKKIDKGVTSKISFKDLNHAIDQ